MSDEELAVTAKPAEQTVTPEPVTEVAPSLEDVYAEFNVGEEQRQPVQSVQSPEVPDPIMDPDGLRKYLTESAATQQASQQAQARQQDERDLEHVVDTVHSQLEGISKKQVKFELADRYGSDPRFAKLWDNRGQNPAALKKALAAIGPGIQKEYAVRPDPQLAENQRAMDEATRATTSAQAEERSTSDKLGAMSGADFDREWDALKAG